MIHTISFMGRFASAVESGTKRQTIRKPRKRSIEVGDILHLYTGQRTKNCRLLGLAEVQSVSTVTRRRKLMWWVGNREITYGELRDLAERDGFATVEAFDAFFEKRHPTKQHFVVIRW